VWKTAPVSPKPANPAIRVALIEEAARIVAEEGPQALSLRRLTGEVGVSTMAVYTHFGAMDELHRAIRVEGFQRLAAQMADVTPTDDPVADLAVLGRVYIENGLTNANLYRAMFMEGACPDPDDPGDAVGLDTFAELVAAVGRGVDAGRLRGDRVQLAQQLWVAAHGCVSLAISGHLTHEDAFTTLATMGDSLLQGAAADPGDVAVSLRGAWWRSPSG
jgi:AcrR family transcriptional regulator